MNDLDLQSFGFLGPDAVAERDPSIWNPRLKLSAASAQQTMDGNRVWVGGDRLVRACKIPWLDRVSFSATLGGRGDPTLFMAWATPGLSDANIARLWQETVPLGLAATRYFTTAVGIIPGTGPDLAQLTFMGATLGGTDGGRGFRSLRAPAWSGPEGHLELYWAVKAAAPDPEEGDTAGWLLSYEVSYTDRENMR